LELVLYTHEIVLSRHGGANGIRDLGLVKSALGRIENGYYNDTLEEAAALWESLSQNHPFIDGNKRTALAVTISFLEMNGVVLEFDSLQTYDQMIRWYETGTFKFDNLLAWLRVHVKKVENADE
jgi:death on curing protein